MTTAIQMPFMDLQQREQYQSIYRSPSKRKRGLEDIAGPRVVTSGIHPTTPATDSDSTTGNFTDATLSPSTMRVTGKLQRLDIQSPVIDGLVLSPSSGSAQDVSTGVGVGAGSTNPGAMAVTGAVHHEQQQQLRRQQQRQSNVSMTTTPDVAGSASSQAFDLKPPQSSSFTFQSKSLDSGRLQPQPEEGLLANSKSPPPSDVTASNQFWHASEITGYSPDDPDEDNYGVNGVGYQKSPALAYSISQKRKQQIADYRSRETKEARQRRGERRLNARLSGSPQPKSPPSAKEVKKPARLVRFEDS